MPRWFRAIVELLSALGLYYLGFRKSEQLSNIAFLIERAIRDFRAVIELSLSGLRGAAFDTVRDVLEIEYLLNDFYHEPSHVAEWLSADTRKLKQKFQSIQLRNREAERLGLKVEDLPANADYKVHSETLHVNTSQVQGAMKGVEEFHESLSLFPMYELFFHGDGILHVLKRYKHQLDEETLKIMDDVSLDAFFTVTNEILEDITRIQESLAD